MTPSVFRVIIFTFLFASLFCLPDLFGQFVFIPLDQTIPDKVVKAREESLVAIRVNMPYLHINQEIYYNRPVFAAGFAVGDDRVVTVLHILGDQPALWYDNANYPTVIEVFDGRAIFYAKAIFWSYKADLLLLKVESPNREEDEFKQKRAKLAQATVVENPKSKKKEVAAEKFFAFSFFSLHPDGFFSLQTGPILAITNFLDNQMLEIPMGIVQTAAEPGFSGGPLLSPEGTVMGLVARGTTAYTCIVLVETIEAFLETAKKKLASENKPAVP